MVTVFKLAVVVEPSDVKYPAAAVTLPITVPFNAANDKLEADKLVNAPVPGVALPMATACNPPPVAVVNVVAPTKFVVLECVTAPVTPSVVPTVKLLVIVLA